MGAQNSSLRRSIEEEFTRLACHDRKYLLLDQLLQLRLPPSAWMLDPSHLGVLFLLDRYTLVLPLLPYFRNLEKL